VVRGDEFEVDVSVNRVFGDGSDLINVSVVVLDMIPVNSWGVVE
jgi:hypothetical protein